MKVLLISNLYPNRVQPERGIFTAQQVVRLARHCEIKVVAPISFFPLWLSPTTIEVPAQERMNGIDVVHPRVWYVPRIGRRLNANLYLASILPLVRELHAEAHFDVIWATWGYPDIVAAVGLARGLQLPVVASLHGSDVNYGFQVAWCKREILQALRECKSVIARSEAMLQILLREGLPREQVFCVYNGVDQARFHFLDRREACQLNGLDPVTRRILFVGNLLPGQGSEALDRRLRRSRSSARPAPLELILLGDGPDRGMLESLARKLGVGSQVRFLGHVGHTELCSYYNAADVFCLSSLNEGLPNAILEALSCGVPVVASRVGGIPELVRSDVGLLAEPANSRSLATALRAALDQTWDRHHIAQSAARFDWDTAVDTTRALLAKAITVAVGPTTVSGPARPRPEGKRQKLLLISRLFPNVLHPTNGPFNGQLVQALWPHFEIEVVAPVPSLPSRAAIPAHEWRDGVAVHHPCFFAIPRLNRIMAGHSLLAALHRLPLQGDAILSSFAWPDGYAATRLGQQLGIPVIVQVIGSDIDLLPRFGTRHSQTLFALRHCDHIYAVSTPLRDEMVRLGIAEKKISVIRNGIDPALFGRRDPAVVRQQLQLPADRKIILYTGWLSAEKGVDFLLRAVAALSPRPLLVLVGADLAKGRMQDLAASLGIAADCRFVGNQPHAIIGTWMNAADLFAFPSLHEGCPNVVLEALACGLPVVATRVGGIPEITRDSPDCVLVPPHNVAALAAALRQGLAQSPDRERIARSSRRTWTDVAREVHQLITAVIQRAAPAAIRALDRSTRS